MQWAERVGRAGLMNWIFMPHFVHNTYINTYMRQLLVCFHRGWLWLDRPYSVDVDLIAMIMGLPKEEGDPTLYLAQKNTTRMKQKYKLQLPNKGFLIGTIEDASMCFPYGSSLVSCYTR